MNEKSNIKPQLGKTLLALIVTLAGAYFAFYLSRSTVDLKYTLSERIIINKQGESVQQLEIKNLGNASAEKIVINLIGEIKSYSITKNAESDEVQEFVKSDGLQIIYPELPPQRSIKIALSAVGRDNSTVSISHSKGEAEEALSSTKSNAISTILALIYFSLFGLYIWLNIKNFFISTWSKRAINEYSFEIVLKRSSPPVLLKKEWSDIKKLALQQVSTRILEGADKPLFSVEENNCFKFLEEKLYADCLFSDAEKAKLVYTAQKSVELLVHMKNDRIYDLSDFKNLLLLKKPKLFSEKNWSSLRADVMKAYSRSITRKDSIYLQINNINDCEAMKLLSCDLDFIDNEERVNFTKTVKENFLNELKQKIQDLKYYNQKDIEGLCQLSKPSFILQHEWDEVMAAAKQKYALLNLIEISNWNMSKNDCEEIFSRAIPQTLQGKEWGEFNKLLEKYYSVFAFKVFFNTFSAEKISEEFQTKHIHNWEVIQKIFKELENSCYIQKAIMSKPEDLADLIKPKGISKQLANAIETYSKEKELLSEELANANKEHKQFTDLKGKVLAQLEIINTVLEAPLSVDRIEDYEDIFSKGNYENLKKISQIIKTDCY